MGPTDPRDLSTCESPTPSWAPIVQSPRLRSSPGTVAGRPGQAPCPPRPPAHDGRRGHIRGTFHFQDARDSPPDVSGGKGRGDSLGVKSGPAFVVLPGRAVTGEALGLTQGGLCLRPPPPTPGRLLQLGSGERALKPAWSSRAGFGREHPSPPQRRGLPRVCRWPRQTEPWAQSAPSTVGKAETRTSDEGEHDKSHRGAVNGAWACIVALPLPCSVTFRIFRGLSSSQFPQP